MLNRCNQHRESMTQIFLTDSQNYANIQQANIHPNMVSHIQKRYRNQGITQFEITRKHYTDFVVVLRQDLKPFLKDLENARIAGKDLQQRLKELRVPNIEIVDRSGKSALTKAFLEGLYLSNYQYTKHKAKEKERLDHLNHVYVNSRQIPSRELETLNTCCRSVCFCRDLVNEPHNFQSAEQFAKTLVDKAKELGVKATVFDKKQIETLKMGGLLGVNKGSEKPPVFIVLEWKPKDTKDEAPVVLVGKGLVYDTGGSNLKIESMNCSMKADMAGGATVASTVFALAAMQSKRHVVALIPATDNRLSANSLVPGDVLSMRSGKTVEVVNTDAEGRLILADALDYAKLYNPRLVIDVATLTGAASRAIGHHGIVGMQKGAEELLHTLQDAGEYVGERIVEFPLWNEYAEELKSNVADLKNCGSGYAGAITAGKFLEAFTKYPYIHLDIAGVAYYEKSYKYHGKHASGFGVRLLIKFLEDLKQKDFS